MYVTEHYQAEISVPEYLNQFVDVETFLHFCQECPNYGNAWSCPPYDFDVIAYWNRYQNLKLFATKIIFDEKSTARTYQKEELNALTHDVFFKEKKALSDQLFSLEKQNPGSISLSAGSCQQCKSCTRSQGLPCRHPDTMRYSLESLGGNVGLTVWKLFGIRLEWMEEGRLPHHFVLISGLLTP